MKINNNSYQTLSVLIPAYNEEKTIKDILKKIVEIELINNLKLEIVVVNDCSKDNTAKNVAFHFE